MKQEEYYRIMLWNGLEIAEKLGGQLSFSRAKWSRVATSLGSEIEKFTWFEAPDGSVALQRKEVA